MYFSRLVFFLDHAHENITVQNKTLKKKTKALFPCIFLKFIIDNKSTTSNGTVANCVWFPIDSRMLWLGFEKTDLKSPPSYFKYDR